MLKSISSQSKVTLIIVLALLTAALVLPNPAHATPFAGAPICSMVLQTWPGAGTAECTGSAAGVDVGAGTVCAPVCSVRARVDLYGEECVAGTEPLFGIASGEMFVDGKSVGNFNWLRVGVALVVVPPDTAAVGVFVPTTLPLPSCAAPGAIRVLVGLAGGSN